MIQWHQDKCGYDGYKYIIFIILLLFIYLYLKYIKIVLKSTVYSPQYFYWNKIQGQTIKTIIKLSCNHLSFLSCPIK